ncbi:MAG: flavin reductase [Gracilimonas sp.]|nr:flavin reductase [Gracilimonas sp.]
MEENNEQNITRLNLEFPVWDQIFTVHPLVIVGTIEPDSSPDFAPKHMAFPLGWNNYFGFVCTPNHSTYQNIKRTGEFTVTYPKPDQLVLTSLTASPRCDNDTKPELKSMDTFPASEVDSHFIKNGYIFLECKLERFVDGFGENSLILGEVIAAHAYNDFIRKPSQPDGEKLRKNPQLVYVSPGRYTTVEDTRAFPFPKDFKK